MHCCPVQFCLSTCSFSKTLLKVLSKCLGGFDNIVPTLGFEYIKIKLSGLVLLLKNGLIMSVRLVYRAKLQCGLCSAILHKFSIWLYFLAAFYGTCAVTWKYIHRFYNHCTVGYQYVAAGTRYLLGL